MAEFILTGKVIGPDTVPEAEERVEIRPSPAMVRDPVGNQIVVGTVEVTTDDAGVFSTTLITMPDLHYTVRSVGSRLLPEITFDATGLTGTVDLADVPATSPPIPLTDTAVGLSALDSMVAGKVTNPTSATRAALSATYAPSAQVFQYTTPQTNTPLAIPAGAKTMTLKGAGGAGGGGSGRRGAAASVRCGGGGGSGGGSFEHVVPTAGLPSTIYITVGAGGAGGAAVTANDTNGNAGGIGATTYVNTDTSFASGSVIVRGGAGNGGSGGTNASGTTGPGAAGMYLGGAGGAASTTGGVGTTAVNVYPGAAGGGGGGGVTSADAASNGGNGGYSGGGGQTLITGGVAPGGAGTASVPRPTLDLCSGGAGGAGHHAGAGGSGGNGLRGSGGGGGGASTNGNSSGAGGNGGDGFVEIVFYF